MTLELGRMRTWRFPDFSALLMALSASLRTEVLTILTVDGLRFSDRGLEMRYLREFCMLAIMGFEHRECPHDNKRVHQALVEEKRGAYRHLSAALVARGMA